MADEPTSSGDPKTDPAATDPKTDPAKNEPKDEPLGEPGKRALEEERNARRTAEKAARDAQAQLDKLRTEVGSDQEKAVAKARAEGKAEALTTATERLVKAEIKVAAAGKFANPNDAVRLLDHDEFVTEDGDVDEKKLEKAIDKLLKDSPYLAGGGKRGDFEAGTRQTAPNGTDMNDLIRSRMRP
jgi:hypothetical protein